MSESKRSTGTDITGLLGVVFITLKLTGYIDWSWWYVTMPFWLAAAVVLSFLAFLGLATAFTCIAAFVISYFGGKK